MKNFFSSLFGRNNDPKSMISFDIIDSIYAYLYNEANSLEIKIKGIHDTVLVNLYTFPTSLDHEEGKAEIKKAGFENSYEVLNELYKKMDIGILSAEVMNEELEYDFIHIQFYSNPDPEMKKYFNHVLNNFIIFFCCTNSLEVNDFKILYTTSFFLDYTKGLLDAEYIEVSSPKNETQETGIKDLKLVLQGICQYLNIEIPENIELPSLGNLVIEDKEVKIEFFEEFIRLVSRGNIEDKLLLSQSKKLFKNFKKETREYHAIVDGHFDFFDSINCWNSDWKFAPEDAEYFISEMIGEDLNFEYPQETYSHDLFPYIQSALGKLNLELMTYDTCGDNYLFFVVNKNEIDRIIELSEIIKIKIDKL